MPGILFINDDWRKTELLINGNIVPYITKIDIMKNGHVKGRVEVGHPNAGTIPDSPVDLLITRHVSNDSGKILRGILGYLPSETVRLNDVNIIRK
jgi:hypothetical protein